MRWIKQDLQGEMPGDKKKNNLKKKKLVWSSYQSDVPELSEGWKGRNAFAEAQQQMHSLIKEAYTGAGFNLRIGFKHFSILEVP